MTARSAAIAMHWESRMLESVDSTILAAINRLEAPTLKTILEHSTAGGKRIRPLLALLSCTAAGGSEQDALPAAAALELLHASSLVHDDIMDGAELRRGQPAVQATYGIPMAILAGDALIAIAFRTLQHLRTSSAPSILAAFSDCFLELCEGQCADIECPGDTLHDPLQHQHMVERKTARLLETCMRIGAMIATDDMRVIDALGTYGLHLGLAYQAMDDLLDATGDEAGTGKSVGRDEHNGRHTFLTLAYPSPDRVAVTKGIVARHTAHALTALDQLTPSEGSCRLAAVAHALLDRRA